LRLLIYEYVSGGGFAEKSIPPSILSEGFGMLRVITEDAKAAGHVVTTILDSRIAELNPPLEAERKIPVDSWRETENAVQEASESSDAAYIIAPETNGILKALVEKVQENDIQSLNSTPKAIARVSDKTLLQQDAKRIGLPTPRTLVFSSHDDQENIIQEVRERIGFPAVFKPVDGVGCEGLSLITSKNQAAQAISRIANQANSRFIAQELVQGLPSSVTVISNGTNATPISLNKQNISLKPPKQTSSYNGGTIPLDNSLKEKAFDAAKKLVETIEGLKGYIGVDLILTKKEPVVIEINPRLTTSYVGTRKILNQNLVQTIIDSTLEQKPSARQETTGYAVFAKMKIINPTIKSLKETFNIPELVTPPFPNPNENTTYALICTQGKTPQQAKRVFNHAKKHLHTTITDGGNHQR
jgi:predicted ATP-grasp superfamily ATP-dependent carboligase